MTDTVRGQVLDFANPGSLGTSAHFKKRFERPILNAREPGAASGVRVQGKKRSAELKRLIAPFMLGRNNDMLAKFLPTKLTQVVCVKMTALQRQLYSAVLQDKVTRSLLRQAGRSGAGRAHNAEALSQMGVLQKICNHPKLLYDTESAKQAESGNSEAATALDLGLFPRCFSSSQRRRQQQPSGGGAPLSSTVGATTAGSVGGISSGGPMNVLIRCTNDGRYLAVDAKGKLTHVSSPTSASSNAASGGSSSGEYTVFKMAAYRSTNFKGRLTFSSTLAGVEQWVRADTSTGRALRLGKKCSTWESFVPRASSVAGMHDTFTLWSHHGRALRCCEDGSVKADSTTGFGDEVHFQFIGDSVRRSQNRPAQTIPQREAAQHGDIDAPYTRGTPLAPTRAESLRRLSRSAGTQWLVPSLSGVWQASVRGGDGVDVRQTDFELMQEGFSVEGRSIPDAEDAFTLIGSSLKLGPPTVTLTIQQTYEETEPVVKWLLTLSALGTLDGSWTRDDGSCGTMSARRRQREPNSTNSNANSGAVVSQPSSPVNNTLSTQSVLSLANSAPPPKKRKGRAKPTEMVAEEASTQTSKVVTSSSASSANASLASGAAAVVAPPSEEEEAAGATPSLIEYSGKFVLLDRMLRQLWQVGVKRERVVIVALRTKTLDLLQKMCEERRYPVLRIDGSTPPAHRARHVKALNDKRSSNVFVMLLSSKAGGQGLNLIGASRLFIFDPDWNPATDAQAAARIWRDGNQRQCYIYRLMCTGTIEEKILQRQISKERVAGQIAASAGNAHDNIGKAYQSSADLADIFSLQPEDVASDTHEMLCRRGRRARDGRRHGRIPSTPQGQDRNSGSSQGSQGGSSQGLSENGYSQPSQSSQESSTDTSPRGGCPCCPPAVPNLPTVLQRGLPSDENLPDFSHHHSVASVDDEVLAHCGCQDVSFVFGCLKPGLEPTEGNTERSVDDAVDTEGEEADDADFIPGKGRKTDVCYLCNKVGHWRRYCPSRERMYTRKLKTNKPFAGLSITILSGTCESIPPLRRSQPAVHTSRVCLSFAVIQRTLLAFGCALRSLNVCRVAVGIAPMSKDSRHKELLTKLVRLGGGKVYVRLQPPSSCDATTHLLVGAHADTPTLLGACRRHLGADERAVRRVGRVLTIGWLGATVRAAELQPAGGVAHDTLPYFADSDGRLRRPYTDKDEVQEVLGALIHRIVRTTVDSSVVARQEQHNAAAKSSGGGAGVDARVGRPCGRGGARVNGFSGFSFFRLRRRGRGRNRGSAARARGQGRGQGRGGRGRS
jgi:hypothetical protein